MAKLSVSRVPMGSEFQTVDTLNARLPVSYILYCRPISVIYVSINDHPSNFDWDFAIANI